MRSLASSHIGPTQIRLIAYTLIGLFDMSPAQEASLGFQCHPEDLPRVQKINKMSYTIMLSLKQVYSTPSPIFRSLP